MSVGKLAAGLEVSRPAVSQHLRVLLDAGLVVQRREGSRCFYQVDPRGVAAMRDYLDRFWDRAHQPRPSEARKLGPSGQEGRGSGPAQRGIGGIDQPRPSEARKLG